MRMSGLQYSETSWRHQAGTQSSEMDKGVLCGERHMAGRGRGTVFGSDGGREEGHGGGRVKQAEVCQI